MAASGHEKPRGSKGKNHNHGVRIDSSLINTASSGSDVQSELSGLGVSVYNQEEFEAGVLQQIDQEVSKRNAEQQRKFLLKEYNLVKHEISGVRLELNNLSKSIAGLLSCRLCDVVLDLRKLRASQDQKRKQLRSLETRELQLLRKVSGKDDAGDSGQLGEKSIPDVAFGIALGNQSSEQQRLIQTGQLTPFGGRVEETTPGDGTTDTLSKTPVELISGECSVTGPIPSCSASAGDFHEADITSSSNSPPSSVHTDGSFAIAETLTLSKHVTPRQGKIGSQGRGLLKLSTDSFDGLFADPVSSLPATQSVKKSGGKLENGGKSRKGKERVKPTQQGGSTSVLRSHKKVADSEVWESLSEGLSLTGPTPNGGGWMPSVVEEGESGETDSRDWMPSVVEEWESGETDGGDWLPSVVEEGESGETNSGDWLPSTVEEGESGETDGGAWMPSTVEEGESGETDGGTWMPSMVEEEESEESEYYTDEELGGEGVSGVEGKSRRKRNLRELSSDDSDGELLGYGRRCKRLVSSAVRLGKHQDDGDEELYRMRIGQYEEGKEEEENQDRPVATFEGGLRVPGSIWSKLYRYQQTGVKWLWELHCQQAGGIVGDEMGLGKTIQMIAFLAGLRESNLRSHVTRKLGLGPVLIVCPATVMHQWVSEFHTWWPPFRVAVLHETGTFVGHKRILVDRIVAGDGVLITTYAGMRTYRDLLLGCKWDYVILDEGHKIRNPDAEMTLACKQFTTPHRLILSGSPMQNNLRELWSLFDFVFPGKLGTLPVFMEQFSVPITLGGYANATEVQVQTAYRCACVLRDTINPYLLRRLKADVKIQLPNKNEQVLFCRLTDYQRELYEDFIHSPGVERMLAVRKRVFSGLMTLRKLCNHPDLVTNDYSELITNEKGEEEEDFEIINISGRKKKKKRKSITQGLCGGEGLESEEVYGYWQRSGKMVVVESLLKLWKAQGHRVLLFTQSKQMLNILERFVSSRGYSYQRMDGGTSISARQPLINKFNQDPSIFVFILTTRVGGLGVNLVGGNRVLIYDPDWNPSTDTQARERAWRIGQTRQVTVYRLLTSGTIEEKIYHRQIFKQFLTNRVLKDPRQRRFFKANNLHELFSLGSSASEGSTETSAIFAGTGSEVLPSRKRMSHERSHDHRKERIPLAGSKRQSHNTNEDSKPKKRRKKERVHFEISLVDSNKGSCGPPESGDEVENTVMETQVSESSQPGTSAETSRSVLDQQASTSTFEMECEPVSSARTEPVQSSPGNGQQSASSPIAVHKKKCRGKHKGKKASSKKKAGRKQQQNAVVEDAEITGVERTGIFEAGDGDALTSKQDDFILRKLFRKSGVHAAMQHDTIMNSSDPDYVLVELEAKKVAQSAARAMKQSRQHCMVAGRLGRPTWTGQHGMTGAPTPQFGSKGKSSTASAQVQSSSHFDGKSANSSSWRKGSLNTSSHVLLARMKSRNTHELPTGGSSGLHQDTHDGLLREMREFIATQCKVDGRATTGEILDRFSCRLPSSSTAVFRSLLHEICDFSRYHGDGMWTLKSGFR